MSISPDHISMPYCSLFFIFLLCLYHHLLMYRDQNYLFQHPFLVLVLTKIFHTVLWYGRYLPMSVPFALVLFFKLINLFIHWFYISTTVSAPSYPTILPSPPFHRPSTPPPSPFRRHKASHGIEQSSSLQDILLFSQVFPLHHIHKHSLTKNLL